MPDPKVLVDRERGSVAPPRVPLPEAAWRLLGVVGALFVVVGGTDVWLTWFPAEFGSAEWEFGTVTASLNGLPLPTLGLILVMSSGTALGWRWVVRVAVLAAVVVAVLIVGAGLLYATNVPIALRAVTQPVGQMALKKAITKTTVQLVAYPAALLVLAVVAWRNTRSR